MIRGGYNEALKAGVRDITGMVRIRFSRLLKEESTSIGVEASFLLGTSTAEHFKET